MAAAIGQSTRAKYEEDQILNPAIFAQMKCEPLGLEGDEDRIVIPVRKVSKPHFRVLSPKIAQIRVGNGEVDETHTKTINMLRRHFNNKRFKLTTYTFDDEGKETQVIFDSKSPYKWWSDDGANQISFPGGDYIRPDLCARDPDVFTNSRRKRSIIVEVVNTHIPEHNTLIRLVELSTQNYIVAFYYISADKKHSQYNRFNSTEFAELNIAFYIMDGVFFKNGIPLEVANGDFDLKWYQYVKSKFFDYPLTHKNEKKST